MSKVGVRDIEAVVNPYGYQVEQATPADASLFENDLDEADKYDLGRTWRQDWKAELLATLQQTADCFIVTSHRHGGAAIFGATEAGAGIAQIWLLQSRSFVVEATGLHGAAWPHQAVMMTRGVIRAFLLHYSLVFNFISSKQQASIRWLKYCGFEFYSCKAVATDMLFFGQGQGVGTLAQDTDAWRLFLGEGIHA